MKAEQLPCCLTGHLTPGQQQDVQRASLHVQAFSMVMAQETSYVVVQGRPCHEA